MKNASTRVLRLALSGCLSGLLLGGCAAPVAPKSETFGKISDSVQSAFANNKARGSDANTPAINEALLPPLQIEAPRSPRTAEPRFDLAVNNAPAGQVFMALVVDTRYSMLLPPDLNGTVTVNLKDVTIREALDALRDLYGYDYRVQGTRITIIPNTLQTRLFQVSYLASKRGGTTSTRVSSTGMMASSPPAASSAYPGGAAAQQPAANQSSSTGESANVFTGVVNDFWFDLSQAMATVLNCDFEVSRAGAGGQTSAANMVGQLMGQRIDKLKCPEGRNYLINGQSGVVMVRALPIELREVERLLKALQANIERQVMIEAKILEVQLSDEFKTGINWAAFGKNGGHVASMNGNTANYAFPGGQPLSTVSVDSSGASITTPATLTGATGIIKSFPVAGALGLAFQSSNFASLISFLQTQGSVYVMSNPRIATLNNQKAVIKVGSDDYYITSVTPPSYTSNGSSTGSTSYNPPTITTQPFFSGIALDVTPQIDDSGNITLHIRPSVTDVSEKDKTINFGQLGTYTLPYASTKVKESDSIVRVRDGIIVAIGGLMSEGQSDGVNKVPGAGDVPLFGHLFKQTERAMNKRELVILLRPTLIQEDADWRQDLEDTEGRMREFDPQRYRQPVDVFRGQ
jgi:MSHA biogenesis protein MshL